jgi:hypothetical protein
MALRLSTLRPSTGHHDPIDGYASKIQFGLIDDCHASMAGRYVDQSFHASELVHRGDSKSLAPHGRRDATYRDLPIRPVLIADFPASTAARCDDLSCLASRADHSGDPSCVAATAVHSGDPSCVAATAAHRVTRHARATTEVSRNRCDFAEKKVHDLMTLPFAATAGQNSRGEHSPKEVRHHCAVHHDQVVVPAPHRKRPRRFQQRPTEVQID